MNTAQRMTDSSAPADYLAPVTIHGDRGRSPRAVPALLRQQFSMAMVVVANEDPSLCDDPSNGGCFYCSGPETD